MVDATITGIQRGTITMDRNFQVEGATVATAADPDPDHELVEAPIYNLVIDHPEGTILWDTGAHHEAPDGYWPSALHAATPIEVASPLDEALDDAGYALSEIDYVFQTHLHMDHAGGLHHFEGTDTPVFVHEEEVKHAYLSTKTGAGGVGYFLPDFDRDLDWRIVRRDRASHFEGVEFLRLPGHTPGLMGTMVHLDDGTVIFTSDLADVTANYEGERPLGARLLWDRGDWFDSLHLVKDLERRHDADVIYGHEPTQVDAVTAGWP